MSPSQFVPDSTLHEALTEAMKRVVDFNASGKESLRILHMYFLAEVLKRYDGNQCRTARRLVTHRNTVTRQVEELNLEPLIEHLRKTNVPQMDLFYWEKRKGPRRSGLAQDAIVLHGHPQAKPNAFSQLSNRPAARSG